MIIIVWEIITLSIIVPRYLWDQDTQRSESALVN